MYHTSQSLIVPRKSHLPWTYVPLISAVPHHLSNQGCYLYATLSEYLYVGYFYILGSSHIAYTVMNRWMVEYSYIIRKDPCYWHIADMLFNIAKQSCVAGGTILRAIQIQTAGTKADDCEHVLPNQGCSAAFHLDWYPYLSLSTFESYGTSVAFVYIVYSSTIWWYVWTHFS